MKNVMKLICLMLALVLALSLGACKKEAAAPATDPAETTAPAEGGETTEPTQAEGETTEPSQAEGETTAEEQTTAPTVNQEAGSEDFVISTEEDELDFNWEIESDEFLYEDEMGTGPMITVTWETYEAMPDAEKEAYRACFSNQMAFDSWEEMALMEYESQFYEEEFWGTGNLVLKDIIEMLIGMEP